MLVGDTGKGHLVSGNMLSGGSDIGEQMFISPSDTRALHGLAVREVGPLTSKAADKLTKRWCGSIFTIALSLEQNVLT